MRPLLVVAIIHLLSYHRLALDFKRHGSYLAFKLKLGSSCPPKRTMEGWVKAIKNNKKLRPQGRPTVLVEEEEEALYNLIKHMREVGAAITKDAIVMMALETIILMRGAGVHLELSDSWAASFRRRWKLSNLRRKTTVQDWAYLLN